MRAEYDFSGGVRGKHYHIMQAGYTITVHKADGTKVIKEVKPKEGAVILEPDVREYFPDSESVNAALRSLIDLIPKKRNRASEKEIKDMYSGMESKELVRRLHKALEEFLTSEKELLIQDAHEEAISTSLIPYLKREFSDFPFVIDGQYDKRIIDSELYKKHTEFLIERLPKSKVPKRLLKGQATLKKEILPDIIFHDRNSSNHNFLVIEIKKSTNKNKADREFDMIKLKVMTSQDLCYSYGAFIDFSTGIEYSAQEPYKLKIIQKGTDIDLVMSNQGNS